MVIVGPAPLEINGYDPKAENAEAEPVLFAGLEAGLGGGCY